jgi:hypothetical protein
MIENHNSEATSRAHHHLCGINEKRMMDAWSEIYFFPFLHLKGSSHNNLHQQLDSQCSENMKKMIPPELTNTGLTVNLFSFSSALTLP